MEQNKDKLESLVNEVDREAQSYASFDDFLASKSNNGDKDECNKDVPGAVVNSSPKSSAKAPETDASSPPASAEPVSPPSERKEKTWWKENPTPNRPEPPSPPRVEQVAWPEAPYKPVETVPVTEEVIELHSVEWDGQTITGIDMTQVIYNDDERLKQVYLAGRKFCVEAASHEAIVEEYGKISRAMIELRQRQKALHSGLLERISNEKSETRTKVIASLNRSNKSVINQKAAARMKVERAERPARPRVTEGMKLVDTLKGNGQTKEQILFFLKPSGKLDEATLNYINSIFPEKR